MEAIPHSSQKSGECGGRRVIHFGNAVLSIVVFVIALVFSMSILDPDRSGHLLSARRRTPPMDYRDRLFMEGYTPVAVQMNGRTVLVVPAADIQGSGDVFRALDAFFNRELGSVGIPGFSEKREMRVHSQTITMADVHTALLLHSCDKNKTGMPPVTPDRDETPPPSPRRPMVLHLCSASSCTTPYVNQQWSHRALAASLLPNKTTACPVSIAALVFGEVSEALIVMEELAEHGISTPQRYSLPTGHLSVMPLVGELSYGNLEASCSASKQCSYRSPVKHTQLAALLDVMAAQLTTEASKKSVFEEWSRRNASYNGAQAWTAVDVRPFTSFAFKEQKALHEFPVDLVYVDIGSSDSVATLAYLTALASAALVQEHLLPQNLIVSVLPSEWMGNVVNALILLEKTRRYTAIPLYNSCMAHGRNFSPSEHWTMSHMRSWMTETGHEEMYLGHFLRRSRAAQTPVCTVLLSRQMETLAGLIEMASTHMQSYPPHASPLERFLYYSIGITPDDENLLTRLPQTAVNTTGSHTRSDRRSMRGIVNYILQHSLFAIPIVMGLVLTWSVCRRCRVL